MVFQKSEISKNAVSERQRTDTSSNFKFSEILLIMPASGNCLLLTSRAVLENEASLLYLFL